MCLGLINVILLFQMELAFQVCMEYLNRGQRLERNPEAWKIGVKLNTVFSYGIALPFLDQ